MLGYAIPPDTILDDETIHIQKLESHQQLPEHLQGLLERSTKGLNRDKANQVKGLLIQYQDIFSKGGHDLGCFTEIKHVIDTGEERPVKQPMRQTPLGFENEEEENLKLMLDTGVITESSSDWASAPVLVRKKDGTVRYCIDYRCLNSKAKKDLFPLPSISQCMDQLSGNQYFSTLDMASGYWQIEIDEKDRHKTAFITKFGLFGHKRMAFGLCNAPAAASQSSGQTAPRQIYGVAQEEAEFRQARREYATSQRKPQSLPARQTQVKSGYTMAQLDKWTVVRSTIQNLLGCKSLDDLITKICKDRLYPDPKKR